MDAGERQPRIRSSTPAIKSRLIGYGRTLLRGDLFIPRMVGYLASAPSASFAQSSVPVRAEDSLAVFSRSGAHDALLAAANATGVRLPKRVSRGGGR
jgi:hypothetical protein